MFLAKLTLAILAVVALIHNVKPECDDLEIFETGVTPKEAEVIVARHNKYRQAIMDGSVPGQPRGVNIKPLKWDDELARTAQIVAETCKFKHVSVKDGRWRYKVGQNIYRTEQTIFEPNNGNWTRAIEMWFLEHTLYKYGRINLSYHATGHYTQLIWHNSELVGCGFASYENERETLNDVAELYVCHYGPPGNVMARYPYQLADSRR